MVKINHNIPYLTFLIKLYPILRGANFYKLKKNIFLIKKDRKKLILKFHNPLTISNFYSINQIYNYINKFGITPPIIYTTNLSPLGKYKDCIVSLQEFIKSDKLYKHKYIEFIADKLLFLHFLLKKSNIPPFLNHIEKRVKTEDITNYIYIYGYEEYSDFIKTVSNVKKIFPKQLIHGDLHENNILIHNNNVFFLDFDSSSYSLPIIDLALCSFRVSNGDIESMNRFVYFYKRKSELKIDLKLIFNFLIFVIIQRIIFIYLEIERGNYLWQYDLKNQNEYLQKAVTKFKSI